MINHPYKQVTLLASNPNITTCKILKTTTWAGYNYQLRYYIQLDKVELIIHKSSTSPDDLVLRPSHVIYNHEKIILRLKVDLVPNEHILEFEKFLLQHALGEVGCLNASV